MRKILLSLFLAVITAATGFTQSLLYSFPFDGSLSATVGTGTFSGAGASYTTDRHGNANKALAKPLDNGYTAPLAVPSGTASRTIALWFKRVGGQIIFPIFFLMEGRVADNCLR